MSDSSFISRDNDQRGWFYQKYVADYLQQKTGEKAIIKDTHGVDVVCGEFKLEVKGTKNLYQKSKKKKKHKFLTVRGWKADQTACPDEVTHFAFVLTEEDICNYPLIYIVSIEDIKERFKQYPDSQWVHFQLHWVFNHYIRALSKIPSLNLDPKELLEILYGLHTLEEDGRRVGLETKAKDKITAFLKQLTGVPIYGQSSH